MNMACQDVQKSIQQEPGRTEPVAAKEKAAKALMAGPMDGSYQISARRSCVRPLPLRPLTLSLSLSHTLSLTLSLSLSLYLSISPSHSYILTLLLLKPGTQNLVSGHVVSQYVGPIKKQCYLDSPWA